MTTNDSTLFHTLMMMPHVILSIAISCFTWSKRMGKVFIPKRWWWHQVQITDFSMHSSDACYFIDMSNHWAGLEMTSAEGDILMNTLRTQVLSNPSPNIPPPIIEIDHLSFDWHSWKNPVIDLNASDVNVHVIVGSTLDTHTTTRVQGLHGPLNLPFLLLGNSTILEILQAIPPPPLKEGLYPRMGVVNITNVNITVYGYPTTVDHAADYAIVETMGDTKIETRSHSSKILTRLWSVNIPDEVFLPLLYATQDAGPKGIDQMQISSVIFKSVGLGYWNHIVQEQKRVNVMMYNTIETVEAWLTIIREKINQSSHVIDTHVDRITSAFEQGLEQMLNDESHPLGMILQKWDSFFFNVEIQGRKFLEENLVINDLAELWNGLGRNISQGWEEFHRKYLSAKT